jgi:predicted DNA-binding WGR domain protein
VKNLENVQGDERDVVILSICYGYDRHGKMLMNFGPINQRGGEKRLNVIFSRARRHMAVVSSIRHHDITNQYNDGANCLRNFLEYAAAASAGDFASARRVLHALAPSQARREAAEHDVVVRELAARLRTRGYETDLDVGQSQFRCDIALRQPGDRAYRLGILVDTETTYRTTDPLERYHARPGVLRAFDWQVALVLAKDWFHDPEDVLERLERLLATPPVAAPPTSPANSPALSGSEPTAPAEPPPAVAPAPVTPPTPATPVVSSPEPTTPAIASAPPIVTTPPPSAPTPAPSPGPAPAPVIAPPTPAPDASRRYFEFVGGNSRKFWEITVDGVNLYVRFGRIGAKGQTQLKSFPTPAAAQAEARKLISEKTLKGYTEASS